MTAPVVLGRLSLDPASKVLSGPRGALQLCQRDCALLQVLTRRPGVLVQQTALIEAVYSDADAEPEYSDVRLRQMVGRLRTLLTALGGSGCRITAERGAGYRLELGRTAAEAWAA